ncbi:MAG: hypothetical protein LBF22_04870, partial [Deltaproteobacteria bacterium]|nr:hypothetical protein [Deltaproteobacteria bacterium]
VYQNAMILGMEIGIEKYRVEIALSFRDLGLEPSFICRALKISDKELDTIFKNAPPSPCPET